MGRPLLSPKMRLRLWGDPAAPPKRGNGVERCCQFLKRESQGMKKQLQSLKKGESRCVGDPTAPQKGVPGLEKIPLVRKGLKGGERPLLSPKKESGSVERPLLCPKWGEGVGDPPQPPKMG